MSREALGWTVPPPHVPAELVVDFDYFDPPRLQEIGLHLALKAIRDSSPPIFWTGRNGGHWIATRATDLEELQSNFKTFSSTGLSIPRSQMPSLPVECDPPLHTALRQIIAPLFTPDTLKKSERLARKIAQSLTESLAVRGQCEFQDAFSRHLPIAIFLNLVDLPLEDGPYLSDLAERRMRTANVGERDGVKQKTIDYLSDSVAERRKNPRGDFISRIIHAQVDGRALSDFEMWNVLATIMFGGLDTVASSLGYVMRFLAMDREARDWLGAQENIPYTAIDELFRRHGVVTSARLLLRDTVFRGVQLRAGEQIQIPTALFGLDEERFEHPLAVRFDRPNAGRHGGFGTGIHRCVGFNLARMEVKVALETWLKRIPDFTLVPDDPPVFAAGMTASVIKLPLKWTILSKGSPAGDNSAG